MSGVVSYHAGLAAEDIVERYYAERGHKVILKRWRGQSGEIDLIACKGAGFIFIEVKKSRSHQRAAQRLSQHQMQRIFATGAEFAATQPNGQNTDMQFDVALVNSTGQVSLIENAIGF